MRLVLALAALIALTATPFAGALLPAGDADGDAFPDAVERLLGASPYVATDTPLEVGVNALLNPGFEVQAEVVATTVTCPVFGDQSFLVAGLVIVSPCWQSALRHPGWTTLKSSATQVAAAPVDADGDGDLEMTIPAGASGHNFYQAFANPQQAFSANFEALSFDVEVDGASLASLRGAVILSTSLSPFNDLNTYVPGNVECALRFDAGVLASGAVTAVPGPAGRTYLHVEVEPTKARFTSYWPGCTDEAAAFNAADDAGKRAILGTMRLVQSSFWNFNGLTFDNVDLRGSTPAAGVPDGVEGL